MIRQFRFAIKLLFKKDLPEKSFREILFEVIYPVFKFCDSQRTGAVLYYSALLKISAMGEFLSRISVLFPFKDFFAASSARTKV